jgi:parallel beta-helix repeat protein
MQISITFLNYSEIKPFFVAFCAEPKINNVKSFIQIIFAFFSLILLVGTSSCKKQTGFSKGNLEFSVDTLVFDTVFTTVGSTTQQFKIYNKENKTVIIEEIELVGGENSPFRINIDGISGNKHANIEILAKDSLYAFVEVTLSVNGQNFPMVIEDSIRFRTNGKDQYVRLAVWGQDAYFYNNELVEGIWANDKPHVIYNRAVIDSAKTLDIQANTKVYLHKNSILFVYKGTLKVNGTKNQEVVFQGDRLEQFYKDIAGQWYGIYFYKSLPSTINYAIIKNGTVGVHLTANNEANLPNQFNVTVTNTKISNNASYGVFLYDSPKIKMENCVVSKNGIHALFLLRGGSYDINHSHLLGYGGSGQTPAIGIRNYYDGIASGIGVGEIKNSIIYGSQTSEIAFDTVNPNNDPTLLNFAFKRCLIKLETPSTNSMYQDQIVWNTDPVFTNVSEGNFKSVPNSPINNLANPLFTLPLDINGDTRNMANPDLGAYEF